MERRSFLKAGLLTISVLYGLPENIFSLKWSEISAAEHAAAAPYPFTGTYSATVADDLVLMPPSFPRLVLQKSHILLIPERYTSALLFTEDSPQGKMLNQMFDPEGKNSPQSLREEARISENGELYLPHRVRKFAGIEATTVAIIGHGNVIEVIDSVKLNSHNK